MLTTWVFIMKRVMAVLRWCKLAMEIRPRLSPGSMKNCAMCVGESNSELCSGHPRLLESRPLHSMVHVSYNPHTMQRSFWGYRQTTRFHGCVGSEKTPFREAKRNGEAYTPSGSCMASYQLCTEMSIYQFLALMTWQ